MHKDYYAALGIDRSASEDDIRKAFRQMSLKYHPDRNPGDKIAEDKYKEITEAFSILSDSNKKSAYDFNSQRPSPFGNPFNSPFNPFNMNVGGVNYSTIFETVFSGNSRRQSRSSQSRSSQRGQNVEFTIQISVEESIKGCTKKIHINSNELKINCQTCDGSGAASNSNRIICSKCAGSGRSLGSTNMFASFKCES